MPVATPRLTIQTASLYASNAASSFTGTGGPFGFSPFTSQFGGIVGSAGLATEPFNDVVYNVAAGDEVIFVVAVQNLVASTSAMSVRIRDTMPAGFVVPAGGLGISVTNGAGTDLAYSGDLFGTAGLTITPALGGYDASSGANVALVTFSLVAGPALPAPYATVTSTASILGYTATAGGSDLAAANPASASTTVITAAPVPTVTPVTDPSAVARGQTVAFDVSVAIPAGTLTDFVLAPVTTAGAATLSFVSTTLLSVGSGLQTGTPVVAADGSLHFGNVVYGGSGSNTVTARVVVRAAGTASGAATLHTVISAVDPTNAGGRWSADVSSGVGVVVPPPPPTLSGLSALTGITAGVPVNPYAAFAIGSSNPNQSGTLAITLQDPSLGRLGNATIGSLNAQGTTFYATGRIADLQAAARQVTFTPASAGTAHFNVTVVDAAGGTAQDSSTWVAAVPAPDPLFDTAFYLAHNPDVAAAGVDPYQHYLSFGWREGRDPNPLFSTSYYLSHNPDVAAAGLNPLVHFEQFGWREGRAPDAYFDPAYYLSRNPDVAAAGVNPLLHFEVSGWREGRDPSLLFSTSAYLSTYRDVAGAGIDPLVHYLFNGRYEGRLANVVGGLSAADPLVDAAYYDRQLGASLVPGGMAAAQQAAWSYDHGGWQAGLNPNAWFNTRYYLAMNPDVAAAGMDPLLHFEIFGWKEGRNPSPQFSVNKYLATYTDVRAAGLDPLVHYVAFGKSEGRLAFPA